MNSRMFEAEISKNETEQHLAEIQSESFKNRFAKDAISVDYRIMAIKPKTFKKPMKYRFAEWWKRFNAKLRTFLAL